MESSNEPLIKKKEYSKEKFESKKRKSFGVAKRIIVMSHLSYVCGVNSYIALIIFIVLVIGTSALPYIFNVNIEFTSETFCMRGGLFVSLSCILIIPFTIASFWFAFAYKRLEIMCIHLYGSLEGAFEVNNAARRSNLKKARGFKSTDYSFISGISAVAMNYLIKNDVKVYGLALLGKLNFILISGQIITAIICVLMLLFKHF